MVRGFVWRGHIVGDFYVEIGCWGEVRQCDKSVG